MADDFGVVTRPEYRKHGLAAQLLNRAIADARQQGRKGLVLTCKDKLVHYYANLALLTRVFPNPPTAMWRGTRCG